MNEIKTFFSYAKVNLGLKILNKRFDGYHDIHSLFIELNLSDKLIFLPNGVIINKPNNICNPRPQIIILGLIFFLLFDNKYANARIVNMPNMPINLFIINIIYRSKEYI